MNRKQKVLIEARALIAKPRGWCKGYARRQLDDGRTAYCSTGALRAASNQVGVGVVTTLAVEDALRDALRDVTGHDYESIIGINDRKATRKRDVLAAFDKAIAAVAAPKKEV